MFRRQTTGSVVCVSCGYLVGVNDERCYHCGRRNPGLWGFAPAIRRLGNDLGFANFVTGLCIVAYGLTLVASGGGVGLSGGLFGFLAPSQDAILRFGASGAVPVFLFGRWWTVLSAVWLHANLLHILFNMMWVRQLAPAVGELYGPGRMVIIYTAAGIASFVVSSAGAFLPIPFLRGAGLTLGASGAIFGLLGALVCYGRRSGSSVIRGQATYYAVVLFIMGLVMPGVDNFAHAGGFAGGYLAARVLDPLKPERVDHLAIAIACLVASILSIVVSIVVPLPR